MIGESSEVLPTMRPPEQPQTLEHTSPVETTPATTHTPLTPDAEQNFAEMIRAQLAGHVPTQESVPGMSFTQPEVAKAPPKRGFSTSLLNFIGSHKILAALVGFLSFGIYSSARASKEGQR